MGASALGLMWAGCASVGRKKWPRLPEITVCGDHAPIDRNVRVGAAQGYLADDPEKAHEALWAKAQFIQSKGGIPAPKEKVPLVIVGGGLSGLLSAYLLRHHKPILLEQAQRFGGNAKGESWDGLDYALGAAYFVKPETGSSWYQLLSELGATNLWRELNSGSKVEWKGRLIEGFWEGATDPKGRPFFSKAAKYVQDVLHERNGRRYPELPARNAKQLDLLKQLDRETLHSHLKRALGGRLHPHFETHLEQYCWSSFGASAHELSAAHGMNFYTEEFEDLVVLPGGNAGVAELVLKSLEMSLAQGNLRPESLVVNVKVQDDEVHVTYLDSNGQLNTVAAKAVVMACPKFVAKKLIDDLPLAQSQAISQIKYRSYLVANILIDGPPPAEEFYDLFLLGNGRHDTLSTRQAAEKRGATDVVLANFSCRGFDSKTVLTMYWAMPFDGALASLYASQSFANYRKRFETQLLQEILPLFGYDQRRVVDLRIARWGHPLPVAEKGLLTRGVLERARADHGRRVFFIEQDNWAQPAIETSASEAMYHCPRVDAFLKQS
jgi:protoporphyrinogen oxidase